MSDGGGDAGDDVVSLRMLPCLPTHTTRQGLPRFSAATRSALHVWVSEPLATGTRRLEQRKTKNNVWYKRECERQADHTIDGDLRESVQRARFQDDGLGLAIRDGAWVARSYSRSRLK